PARGYRSDRLAPPPRPQRALMAGYDGIVSRYLNRPISRPMARACAGTPLTPNSLTSITLLLAMAAAGCTAAGSNIAGGIGIQLASVFDGVDGELARLKNLATKFG